MNFANGLMNTIKENQILLTGLGLSGAGILTFWLKDVPRRIISLIKRELMTELIVTSQHKAFYDALKWIEINYKDKNFRRLKLINGKYGDDDETVTSIGYGIHWIRYKKKLFMLELNKESSNQTERDKETLTITILGRNKKIINEFIKEIQKSNKDKDKVAMCMYENGRYWGYVRDQRKRSLESIFIEQEKLDKIINLVESFRNNEEWYINNGIPYQLGILLYGPPGTGKTSLIKAIASYFDYTIYYLPPQKLYSISEAVSGLEENCILVIEDIDSNSVTASREEEEEDEREKKIFTLADLSQVLNSLDGMLSCHGRILIATTNHLDKLDPALIRPGRIDLKVEIGYVTHEALKKFMNRFFPNNKIDVDNLKIRPNVTIAELQNMVLQGYNEYDIIKNIVE